MNILPFLIFFTLLLGMLPGAALSEVVVHDVVALTGEEVMLKAMTGTFLGKSGELVEFFVDGKSIGKNLSGRDGFAVKRFIPVKTGLYKIHVKSGDEKDNGILLALGKKTRVVFIDVEGSLLGGPFMAEARPGSSKAVTKIRKRFPVVYLQKGFWGIKTVRLWLKKNKFPEAPVLPWGGGEIFKEIREKDLRIKAVVGGPEVIASAEEYKPLAFSFDSVEDAEVVADWQEIEKTLK